MIKNPCYGCNERQAGCHSKCDKYKKWKEEYEKKQKAIYRKRSIKIYGYEKQR